MSTSGDDFSAVTPGVVAARFRERESSRIIYVTGAILLLLSIGFVFGVNWIIVGVAVAAGVGLSFRPFVGLCAVLSVRILIDLLWWIKFSIAGMSALQAMGGALMMGVLVLVAFRFRAVQHHPVLTLLLCFGPIFFAGSIRADSGGTALVYLARFMAPFLCCLLATAVADTTQKRQMLIRILLVSSIVPVIVSFYHYFSGTSMYMLQGYLRLVGGYKNLHNHALTMAGFTMLSIFLGISSSDRRWRVIALAVGGAAIVLTYLTFVRTALVAVGVFSLVFLAANQNWRWLTVACFGGVLFLLQSTSLQSHLSDIVVFFRGDPIPGGFDQLGSGRIGIWKNALNYYFQEDWATIVIGQGFDRYIIDMDNVQKDAHNEYLHLLIVVGPIGLFLYVFALLSVTMRSIKVMFWGEEAWDRMLGVFGLALSMSVFVQLGISNSFIQRPTQTWTYWALAGAIYAVPLVARRTPLGGSHVVSPIPSLGPSPGQPSLSIVGNDVQTQARQPHPPNEGR